MKTINIGIVGGCMTCQSNLKLSQLFYRSLMKKLLEKDRIKCFVNLRYYNEYFRIPEKTKDLLKKSKVDILILQVRPAPFIMRSEFLIQDYRGKFIINPLIRSYNNLERIETILATKDPVILYHQDFIKRKDRLVLLRILRHNIRIGQLFGLEQKAILSLKNTLEELKGISKEKGIPLIIIGTIHSSDKMHNRHLGMMNHELKEYACHEKIEFIDLFSVFNQDKDLYFMADHYHLNENGHEVAARKLYEIIKNMPVRGEVAINS